MPSDEVQAAGRRASIERANARVRELAPVIKSIQRKGIIGLSAIAHELTRRGIPTARGREIWTSSQVRDVLRRLEKLSKEPT
jgi:Recombinase